MTESIISVNSLNKFFKKKTRGQGFKEAFKGLFKSESEIVKAIDNVNFNVSKGEILGYLGPNGAGKSTVIKVLTGVLHPDSGDVKCLGFNPWHEREKYVKNIGAVFGQKSTLWWDIPPIDTFELNRFIYDIPKQEFSERLNNLINYLGVNDVSRTPTRKLSFGERMKCEFINCLLHNPKIIFLDEPTVGVDIVAKEKIRQFIKRINKELGVTVILTTHDINDVEELCDRLIIVDKGSHVYDGTINELKKKFITHKRLIVEFEKPVNRLVKIPNAELVSNEGIRAEFKVDIKRTSVSKVIQLLFSKYKIDDFDIKEQTVESIISEIYRKGSGD